MVVMIDTIDFSGMLTFLVDGWLAANNFPLSFLLKQNLPAGEYSEGGRSLAPGHAGAVTYCALEPATRASHLEQTSIYLGSFPF